MGSSCFGPLLLAICLATAWEPLRAQTSIPVDPLGTKVLGRTIKDRWVFDGQHPGFVTFDSVGDWIHLKSQTARTGNRTRRLELRFGNIEATLTLDPDNRVRSSLLDLPGSSDYSSSDPEERAEARRRQLRGPGSTFNLPEARLWEITFILPPAELTLGMTWTDTLAFGADPGEGLFQEMTGIWNNRVVGDTVVDGRILPLVRTDAAVHYRSVEPMRDYAVEGPLIVEREGVGTISGRAAIDTVLGVRAKGLDSLQWEGTATLRTQDGLSFPSPIRYQGVRTWVLLDSLDWVVLQDSLRAQARKQRTGMLFFPRNPLEERLASGDSLLADSLLAAWMSAEDPNERQGLWQTLSLWGSGSGIAHKELDEWRVGRWMEMGDTAGVVQYQLGSASQILTEDRLAILLPYLTDLGRLWRLGVNPRFAFQRLADDILESSPLLEPDSSRWRCTPEACRQIIALLDTIREPRFRDVALVGAFSRNPVLWYDSIRSRAEAGSLSARRALSMAQGVGSTWASASKDPIPERGAHWHEWLSWMGGTVRFETSHRNALRLYTAYTGRDPLDELRQAWPPEGDSARLVLGMVLREMNALPPSTAEELVTEFLSGSKDRIWAATRELDWLRRPDAPLAESDLIRELVPALLESVVSGGSSPWPGLPQFLPGDTGQTFPPRSVGFGGIGVVPVFVLDENLPPGADLLLEGRAEIVDSVFWATRPRRSGGALVRVSPVRAEGPFAVLTWSWVILRERAPDESPSGYAGGGQLLLLRTEDGWKTVDGEFWIT